MIAVLLALTFALSSQPGSSLSGRVVNAEGVPIPRMVVRLHSAAGGTPAETLTDTEGRYAFNGVAPGRYAIEVANDEHRATYLRQWFGYDEPAATFSGPPRHDIEVTPDTNRSGLDVAVKRGVSIEGRVIAPFGDPLADVEVILSRADGRLVLRAGNTDDLGGYRLYGLAPGRYRVCANVHERHEDGGDPIAMPMAPTCHPAALTAADGADVSVNTRDVTGIDITIQRLGGRTISGSVTDAAGAPVDNAWVSIHTVQNGPGPSASVRTRAGTFSVSGLLPGRYSVVAATGNAPPGFGSDSGKSQEVGFALADVTAVAAPGVQVRTTRPRVVTGRIVFEGAAPRSMGTLKVLLRPTEATGTGILGNPPSAAARADGSFEVGGVHGVPSVLDVAGLPPAWAILTVKLNDANVTLRAVDYAAPSRARVDVILTSAVTSPVLRVVNEGGEPVANAQIVVTPKDPALWRTALRWIEAKTGADGTIALPSMIPGDYLMAALPLEDAVTLLRDPERLDAFATFATAVRLDRGEPRISLPQARLPEKK